MSSNFSIHAKFHVHPVPNMPIVSDGFGKLETHVNLTPECAYIIKGDTKICLTAEDLETLMVTLQGGCGTGTTCKPGEIIPHSVQFYDTDPEQREPRVHSHRVRLRTHQEEVK